MSEGIYLSWSGGKDCALALRALRLEGRRVAGLLTTVTEGYDRVSMHGVCRVLLEAQAAALGLPLMVVMIPQGCSDEAYRARMLEATKGLRRRGVSSVAFGDVHLEDVRAYREENLEGAGMDALFPLWGKAPASLVEGFVDDGFSAIVTCVDTEQLDGSFSGRWLDRRFLDDLPDGVDPCGENGEYHTFVFDGPVFGGRVDFVVGERVLRDGRFLYTDLVP